MTRCAKWSFQTVTDFLGNRARFSLSIRDIVLGTIPLIVIPLLYSLAFFAYSYFPAFIARNCMRTRVSTSVLSFCFLLFPPAPPPRSFPFPCSSAGTLRVIKRLYGRVALRATPTLDVRALAHTAHMRNQRNRPTNPNAPHPTLWGE